MRVERYLLFPARAGMNQTFIRLERELAAVPRSCGDEPAELHDVVAQQACSPLVRG